MMMTDPQTTATARPHPDNQPATGAPAARRRLVLLLVLACTLLGGGLRFYALAWGLPSETRALRSYHPDEGSSLNTIAQVRNPFRYPSLDLVLGTWHLYTTGAAIQAAAWLGFVKLTGDRAFYEHNLAALDRIYLSGRALAALLGTLAIPLLYFVARQYAGSRAALLAAALGAVNALYAMDARYTYTTIPVVFWGLLAWWCIARVQFAPQARRRYLFGALFFTALAALVQFHALIFGPAVACALWLRHRAGRPAYPRRTLLACVIGGFVAGSLLGCPNAWFDLRHFLGFFLYFLRLFFTTAPTGPANFLGNPVAYYLTDALPETCGPILFPVLLAGVLALLVRRTPAGAFLLFFLATYLGMLSVAEIYMVHYLNLALPALFIAAAMLLDRAPRRVQPLLIATVLSFTLWYTAAHVAMYGRVDPRTQASRWLEDNVAPGASVGVNQIYFYSVPVIQQVGGSPFRVSLYEFALPRLLRERPEYFVLCDFEFGIGDRALRPEYKPAMGSAAFFNEILHGDSYELVRGFHQSATLFGVDWSPARPSWHWRFPSPRVWIFRRIPGA